MLIFLIQPFLAGALLSAVLTIPTIVLARKYNLVDNPIRRPKTPARIHQGNIPRAGGAPIFLSLLICSLWFLGPSKKLFGILAGGGLIALVGLLDDWRDLNPYLRLVTNFLAAILVVGAGIGIPYITNPFGGIIHLDQPQFCFKFFGIHCLWLPADLLALLFIPWMMNAINWSKGVPGQMPGFVAIAALTTSQIAYRFAQTDPYQWSVVVLSLLVAGVFVGFLIFNFHPQKIMPGYGGGSLAGFLLAILAILSFNKVATVLLVLWLPLIDAVVVLSQRLFARKSPVRGDQSHLHHLLLKRGWSFRRISLFYWAVSAILGLLALQLDAKSKLLAALILGFLIFSGLIWLRGSLIYLEKPDRAKRSKI